MTHNKITKKVATFCKYKMKKKKKKIGSTLPSVLVEFNDVTKVVYERTNPGSRLREIIDWK